MGIKIKSSKILSKLKRINILRKIKILDYRESNNKIGHGIY